MRAAAETAMLAMLQGGDDPRNRPKKPKESSECIREQQEQGVEVNSPSLTPGNQSEPERTAVVPNDLPSHQERPKGDRDERVNKTIAQSLHTVPRGEEVDPGRLGSVRRNRTCNRDCDEPSGIQEVPRGDGDERNIKTSAPCRDPGGGGQLVVQGELDDVERDLERGNDGDGDGYDGIRGKMDGATSDVRTDSKRVKTKSLARQQASQHECNGTEMVHVPAPATTSKDNPRRIMHLLNPPRRRGKLKTTAATVSQPRPCERTHQSHGHVVTISGDIYSIYLPYRHQQKHQDRSLTCADAAPSQGFEITSTGGQLTQPSRNLLY